MVKKLITPIRFGLVGIAGFLVDSITLKFFLFIGFNIFLAQLISYFNAATTTWILNRRFTFNSQINPSFVEWVKYIGTNLFGGISNYVVFILCISSSDSILKSPVFAVALGSIVGMILNYTLSYMLVFNKKK